MRYRLEEIDWPPRHASIDTRAAGDGDIGVKDATCDLGRAVECDIGGEDAAIELAADAHVPGENIAVDETADGKNETIGDDLSHDCPVNVQLARRFENAGHGERLSKVRYRRDRAFRVRRRCSRLPPKHKRHLGAIPGSKAEPPHYPPDNGAHRSDEASPSRNSTDRYRLRGRLKRLAVVDRQQRTGD